MFAAVSLYRFDSFHSFFYWEWDCNSICYFLSFESGYLRVWFCIFLLITNHIYFTYAAACILEHWAHFSNNSGRNLHWVFALRSTLINFDRQVFSVDHLQTVLIMLTFEGTEAWRGSYQISWAIHMTLLCLSLNGSKIDIVGLIVW